MARHLQSGEQPTRAYQRAKKQQNGFAHPGEFSIPERAFPRFLAEHVYVESHHGRKCGHANRQFPQRETAEHNALFAGFARQKFGDRECASVHGEEKAISPVLPVFIQILCVPGGEFSSHTTYYGKGGGRYPRP
jgi:hypothetical protein